jgi:hypothetical protein
MSTSIDYKVVSVPYNLKAKQHIASPVQVYVKDGKMHSHLPVDRFLYFLGQHLKSGVVYLLHGSKPVDFLRPALCKEDVHLAVGLLGNLAHYSITDMKYKCDEPNSNCRFLYTDGVVGGELLLPAGMNAKRARVTLDYAADPVKSGVASSRPDIIHQTRDLEVLIRTI